MAQPPRADWCWRGAGFCGLYGNPRNCRVVFAVAYPQGLGPSLMAPVPSPVFCSESAFRYWWDRAPVGVLRGTNEDVSVRDTQGVVRDCRCSLVSLQLCERSSIFRSRRQSKLLEGEDKRPKSSALGNEASGVASEAMTQVSRGAVSQRPAPGAQGCPWLSYATRPQML